MKTRKPKDASNISKCISHIPSNLYLGPSAKLRLSNQKVINLLNHIHKSVHAPSQQPLNLLNNSPVQHQKFIESTDFVSAVPPSVQQYVRDVKPTHHATYSGTIHNTKINVHFCLYGRKEIAKLARWVNHVERWLQFALGIPSTGCRREHVDIMIVMTPLQKMLPTKGEMASETHANTAFTYACSSHNRIVIYRKEDWFKTLVHETFHCFGLDFCNSPNADAFNATIAKMFPGTSPATDYRIYESYCETWAQIINHLFAIPGGTDNTTSLIKIFERRIRRDTAFVVWQMQKYLAVYGLTYADLSTSKTTDSKTEYKEDTNVFSYYVLRSGLLWRLDAFLDYCVNNADSDSQFIDFGKDARDKIAKYVDLIERVHKDAGFLKIADWIQKKYIPIANRKCDKKTRKQFRMTMVEHV